MSELPHKPKSRIAERISRLFDKSQDAAKKRERLPQPLFWSLFYHEITSIRREKEEKRLVQEILGPES